MLIDVEVDGKTTRVERFLELRLNDEDPTQKDIIVLIDDRHYRLRHMLPMNKEARKKAEYGTLYYHTLKIKNHPRSVQGHFPELTDYLVRIHRAYKAYEKKVSGLKEEAQFERDGNLHKIADLYGAP